MSRLLWIFVIGAGFAACLTACGGGSSGVYIGGPPPPPPPEQVSYIGTTGVFAAWADNTSGTYAAAPTGSYAGKRQSLRGTVDFVTGANLSQPAGIEVYKGSDGHIYGLDLTSSSPPTPQQLSSETQATVDDTCSLSGAQVGGVNYDYVGVYFTADLQTPTNSSYFYRLPGPDGTCGTADDVIHMVKTGMSSQSAPVVVSDIPVATVRTATGGISGFVVKNGTDLVLVDGNFANPVVLGTFATAINVAVALPVGTTQGYPTAQLYVVDGNIVYVDYVAHTTSAPLYTIPNWLPTAPGALFAASPDTLYFSINTPASGSTPASASIYSMPANGSAAPAVIDSEPGRVTNLVFPVQGANLLWGLLEQTYFIKEISVADGSIATLVSGTQNSGNFTATASAVYYETWMTTNDAATMTITHTGTQSGIVAMDGSVVQQPLANSTFVSGGEQQPWPSDSDTTTTNTPFMTLFQVQGLTPVTVSNSTNGYTYTEDGVSGGSLVAIDAATNQIIGTVGVLPASTAVTLNGTFRGNSDTGFLEAANPLSTEDPASRDLYLLSAMTADSLTLVTGNL